MGTLIFLTIHKMSLLLFLYTIILYFQVLRHESLKGVPLVILANKQDLPGCCSPEGLSQKLDLKRACAGRAWFLQPCSAITGMGLEEGFRRMVYLMKTPLGQTQEHIKLKMKAKGFKFTSAKKVLSCGSWCLFSPRWIYFSLLVLLNGYLCELKKVVGSRAASQKPWNK